MSFDRRESPAVLSWHIEVQPGLTHVVFSGELNEDTDLARLVPELHGPVCFHLGEVRRVNSCGVREWILFMRQLTDVTSLRFTHCSPAVVLQLNMISNFRGNATIASVFAPHVCDRCGHETDALLELDTGSPRHELPGLPELTCPDCDTLMQLDDLPRRYLGFLLDP